MMEKFRSNFVHNSRDSRRYFIIYMYQYTMWRLVPFISIGHINACSFFEQPAKEEKKQKQQHSISLILSLFHEQYLLRN